MAEMTSAERVITVLRNEEPDRIPHFEWAADRKVREVLCPGCSYDEFVVRMEWDAILTSPDFKKEQIGPDLWKNEWGIPRQYSGEEDTFPIDGPIRTLDDLERYEPPDPHAEGRYASIEATVGEFKGNVDCAHTLIFGSVKDVIEETKEAIRNGAPGGGFILSSGNTIHSGVKPGNYLAMLHALRMYRE